MKTIKDCYFGDITLIDYENTDLGAYAKEFFFKRPLMEYTSFIEENGDIYSVEGFFNFDNFRIPFRYEKTKSGSGANQYSFNVDFYVSTIYTRDKDFNDVMYHMLQVKNKNVYHKEVDNYYQKLLELLPIQVSGKLKYAFETLYMYPFIDPKNGKTMRCSVSIINNHFDAYIAHHHSCDNPIVSFGRRRDVFHFDGTNIYPDGGISTVSTLSESSIWPLIASSTFREKELLDIMSGDYKSYNEYMLDLEKSLEVIAMIKV
jgi:hypothetical protein